MPGKTANNFSPVAISNWCSAFLLKLHAASGYRGPEFQAWQHGAYRQINPEIVKRSELHKFVELPE